jgi:predicted nucleic acid-binding protein
MLPLILECKRWLRSLRERGVKVILPEIIDYKLRRELIRANRTKGIARLNRLAMTVEYLPLTTVAMRQAAQFWAQARQQGQPTAGDKNIDADVILAAQAATFSHPGIVIATTNVRHLARFVPADLWQNIT